MDSAGCCFFTYTTPLVQTYSIVETILKALFCGILSNTKHGNDCVNLDMIHLILMWYYTFFFTWQKVMEECLKENNNQVISPLCFPFLLFHHLCTVAYFFFYFEHKNFLVDWTQAFNYTSRVNSGERQVLNYNCCNTRLGSTCVCGHSCHVC